MTFNYNRFAFPLPFVRSSSMSRISLLALVAAVSIFNAPAAFACGDDANGCGSVCGTASEPTVQKAVKGKVVTTTYKASMACANCAKGIANTLTKLDGVSKVDANVETQTVTVSHTEKVNLDALNAVLKGHFKLEVIAAKPEAAKPVAPKQN